MKTMKRYLIILYVILLSGCDYLDVVPDDVATIDHAFYMRASAERYLFTCYSWMPNHASLSTNPGFLGGDEMWAVPTSGMSSVRLARGLQNQNSSLLNYWDGTEGRAMFQGLRDCNIFLENVRNVPDLEESMKNVWEAEVKFLKAYYHFWLMRMYGPIPLIKENLPIDATIDQVQVHREPVDMIVDYIVELMDEAIEVLPEEVDMQAMAGRINKPIAMAVKAQVLVTAASPLFNGNPDYIGFKNARGENLFNAEHDLGKWKRAMDASKEAIDLCSSLGYQLYRYLPGIGQTGLSESTLIQMSIRNSVTERWNSEVIWGNSNSLIDQPALTPRTWDPSRNHNAVAGAFAPTLKIAEMFYSKNGVPINEDKDYDYANRYDIQVASNEDRLNIREGYTTAKLHFDREDRFYASLGFDGGVWYGQGNFDESNNFYIQNRMGGAAGLQILWAYSVTGYWPKKLINPQNVIQTNSYTQRWYSWPVIRLADLYLMYAEAYNEYQGPGEEVFYYLDQVRERAGLKGVQESWTEHSNNPGKFSTQQGLRQIIHHERLIELALEGKRYWDLRRWKRAHTEQSMPIEGWDVFEQSPEGFYRKRVIFNQTFRQRDYLWPLNEGTLLRNKNLVQNPGW
ncbi:RagB/SusD family nutrient uptake outer membrane protein [Belliella marina]|uniref:RagB/SusD family nutrient uptake outer membrane protein n=1 Tax=Belliella marina TaxID=1644146 RepID=A0ABW4VND6_9BACT